MAAVTPSKSANHPASRDRLARLDLRNQMRSPPSRLDGLSPSLREVFDFLTLVADINARHEQPPD